MKELINEERIALRVEHKNSLGDVMILSFDRDGEIWFQHDACNKEPERMKDIMIKKDIKKDIREGNWLTYPDMLKGFKYTNLEWNDKFILSKFFSLTEYMITPIDEYQWR